MERLTIPGYQYHELDFMDSGIHECFNRLSAYEDTGLTPEEVTLLLGIKKMTAIEQCRFCTYFDRDRPSFYGEYFWCDKLSAYVAPESRCAYFTPDVPPAFTPSNSDHTAKGEYQ